MRGLLLIIGAIGLLSFTTISFPEHLKKTNIALLKENDSLVYYQCHVEEAVQELTTASGEKIKGKSQKYTITDKFVIKLKREQYRVKYYSSSLVEYPNKKFAYLKLVEKDYWHFKLEKDSVLSERDVLIVAALENKSHETTEYDFKVNHQNPNEIIIMGTKVMSQLIVEGKYLLKKNLEVLK
jgi:hypothetical protein